MFATATISKDGASVAVIHNAQNFDLVKGAVADVVLTGVIGRVDWSADNDEVLDIQDDAGVVAKITATHTGTSHVELKQRGRVVGTMVIRVYRDRAQEAVTLAGSIGIETPDQ